MELTMFDSIEGSSKGAKDGLELGQGRDQAINASKEDQRRSFENPENK